MHFNRLDVGGRFLTSIRQGSGATLLRNENAMKLKKSRRRYALNDAGLIFDGNGFWIGRKFCVGQYGKSVGKYIISNSSDPLWITCFYLWALRQTARKPVCRQSLAL